MGEQQGHEFRGNQYSGGGGVSPEKQALVDAVQKQIKWEGASRAIVARGGSIPASGPIYFSTDANLAVDYSEGRELATFVIEKSAIIEEGTRDWQNIFPGLESDSPDFFTQPPAQVTDWLKDHPWVAGIASSGGQYIRIENRDAAMIVTRKDFSSWAKNPPKAVR